MSARDINMTSRQATGTLSNSQLALLDGRSIYLDFFGLILWDFVPSNPQDIKQIEVVRGPASAVWGANALTGVVNIITKTPREAPGRQPHPDRRPLRAATRARRRDRDRDRTAASARATRGAPNDTWSYKLSAGYFNSDPFPRPAGTIPRTTHPLDPRSRRAAPRIRRIAGRSQATAFQNTAHQPAQGRPARGPGSLAAAAASPTRAATRGRRASIHTGIGPFDIQSGSYMGYGRVGYIKGGFKAAAFVNLVDADAPNLLAARPARATPST